MAVLTSPAHEVRVQVAHRPEGYGIEYGDGAAAHLLPQVCVRCDVKEAATLCDGGCPATALALRYVVMRT